MVNKLSRKRKYALLLALTIVVLAVAATNNLVSADPCSAYLSQPPPGSGTSYSSSMSLIVPVSATCPSVSGPLYVVGDAYDTTTSTDLGSVNTPLTPVNGPSMFSGQLAFTLPPVAQGDVVQITASIYSGVYSYAQTGPVLTTTTIQIDPNGLANTQDPPSSSPSQYCGSGPNCNYSNGWNGNSYSQGSQGSYGNYHHHHSNNSQYQYQQQQIVTITQPVPVYIPPDNTWLINLVIVSVIATAVVGTIAFAILASRHRHPQPPRPY